MSGRVEGRVALVTGAGSGIGRASACTLAREGARLVVADNREEPGQETAELIAREGGKVLFLRADVSSAHEVQQVVEETVGHFGSLDILHNNAGTAIRRPVTDQDDEEWDRLLQINLKSVYLACKYAIPHMLSKGGSIINTASVTGLVGVRSRAAYSTSKGGIVILTKNMALDYAAYGIRINCVCPGFVETPLIDALLKDPDRRERLKRMHPLGRLGSPQDVANAVLFLASDEASWITGHALVVDGGFSVGRPEDI